MTRRERLAAARRAVAIGVAVIGGCVLASGLGLLLLLLILDVGVAGE